jgi:hypothetical protein
LHANLIAFLATVWITATWIAATWITATRITTTRITTTWITATWISTTRIAGTGIATPFIGITCRCWCGVSALASGITVKVSIGLMDVIRTNTQCIN